MPGVVGSLGVNSDMSAVTCPHRRSQIAFVRSSGLAPVSGAVAYVSGTLGTLIGADR